jgi:hypothetical protein
MIFDSSIHNLWQLYQRYKYYRNDWSYFYPRPNRFPFINYYFPSPKHSKATDELNDSGILLSYLLSDEFLNSLGGRERLKGKTTRDVVEIIKYQTTTSEGTFVQFMEDEQIRCVHKANHFISHAWDNQFLDLLDSLAWKFHPSERGKVILWMDILCVDQHHADKKDQQWFSYSFKKIIQSIHSTILVVDNFHDPFPLRRAWCVWEIYHTITSSIPFHVIQPRKQQYQMEMINTFEIFILFSLLVVPMFSDTVRKGMETFLRIVHPVWHHRYFLVGYPYPFIILCVICTELYHNSITSLLDFDVSRAKASNPDELRNIFVDFQSHGLDKINEIVRIAFMETLDNPVFLRRGEMSSKRREELKKREDLWYLITQK